MKASVILIALIMIFSSCKEKKSEPKPHISLDPEFKEYFVPDYNVGTKLNYEDTTFNKIEVVEVLKITEIKGTVGEDFTSENYRYELTSNITSHFILDVRQDRETSGYSIFLNSGNFHSISKSKGGSWEPEAAISFIDSVVIFGKTYYDVLESRDHGYYDKIWIAKNTGIIAKFSATASFYLKKIE